MHRTWQASLAQKYVCFFERHFVFQDERSSYNPIYKKGACENSKISSIALKTHNQDHLFLTKTTIYSGFYPEKHQFFFPLTYLACMDFEEMPLVLSFAWIILEFRWKGSNYSACTIWHRWALIFHQEPKSSEQENQEIFLWMYSTARGTCAIKAELFEKTSVLLPIC